MSYKEISQKKIEQRDSKFRKEWLVPEDKLPGPEVKDVHDWPSKSGYLSKEEVEITESNPLTIMENIRAKKWSSYKVTSAFAHRATIAHQLINCLTEIFIEEGLEYAKKLDEEYERTGKLKGPYHGLPVSLKDNQPVIGVATSVGFTSLADDYPDSEGLIVTTLRDLGAVFYVKTNLPTAMMMLESTNYLWGKTMNPFNRDLTCGGSSGGEAALVGIRGSPMGIGGDLGGSLRCPGGFQNLFTIKTTSGRWPVWGGKSVLAGFESALSVNGPISTTVDMLEMYGSIITSLNLDDIDPRMVDYGWKKDIKLKKSLTFAICYDDGVVRPLPPVQRGLKIVSEKLKEAGHNVIEWDASALHGPLQALVSEFFASGSAAKIREVAAKTGEPLENVYIKRITSHGEMSVPELWEKQAQRTTLVKKFLDQWVSVSKDNGGLDAIISPIAPFPAGGHNEMDYIGYTSVWNGLDWPSGTVPVTRAQKDVDISDPSYIPRNDYEEAVYKAYNEEKYHGGPVAVQVIGRKMQDEKVLKMMRVVAQAVGTENYWFEGNQ